MTPGNIVGMAMLAGFDVIAITDHQTCGNCAAAIALSESVNGPLVIPGIEVESSEEIHLVCLFPDLITANLMEKRIQDGLLPIKNRPEIFGEQLLFNDDDECVGHEDRLLLQACQLSCDEIARDVLALGGVCIPAHIDRQANSIISTLGAIPEDFPTVWIELSKQVDPTQYLAKKPELARFNYLVSSDSHHLLSIEEPGWPLEIQPWESPEDGRRHVLIALRP
ncbi:MAG: phosphoesterase [Eubacteriales bacterium]|nr:phosphoesterase [Eubacteriales bacterium]